MSNTPSAYTLTGLFGSLPSGFNIEMVFNGYICMLTTPGLDVTIVIAGFFLAAVPLDGCAMIGCLTSSYLSLKSLSVWNESSSLVISSSSMILLWLLSMLFYLPLFITRVGETKYMTLLELQINYTSLLSFVF